MKRKNDFLCLQPVCQSSLPSYHHYIVLYTVMAWIYKRFTQHSRASGVAALRERERAELRRILNIMVQFCSLPALGNFGLPNANAGTLISQ